MGEVERFDVPPRLGGDSKNFPGRMNRELKGEFVRYSDHLAALEEAEACATCHAAGVVESGECLGAMSGPTCMNPDCPPCQTPELVPCDECSTGHYLQGREEAREGEDEFKARAEKAEAHLAEAIEEFEKRAESERKKLFGGWFPMFTAGTAKALEFAAQYLRHQSEGEEADHG